MSTYQYYVYDADPATGGSTEFELDGDAPDAADYDDDPDELLSDALDWAEAEASNCGYGLGDRVWVTVDGSDGCEVVRGSREVQ